MTSSLYARIALVVVAAPGILFAQARTDRAFPPDSAVLAIIKQRVEEKRSVGIVVGLLEADGRTRVVVYGSPGKGQLPLDGNSVFEIGSITKVFTGTMLAQMVQEGAVSLDDPVQKFMPAGVKIPERAGKQITIGMLSTQNSGLPRMPNNFSPRDRENPYADYTPQQMYDFLGGYTLTRDPGESFEYSNLGVGLLGHTLALKSGKTYELLVMQRILQPLGMRNTAITFSPWMREHLALGHDAVGMVTSNWDIPTFAGAGALRSTANDMLKFVAAAANTSTGPLAKAFAFAEQPRAQAGPTMMIGLNWISRYTATDTIVWHNGGTGGYRTFAGVIPSRRMGVVVLTNSGGQGADDIGLHLLDPSIPLAPATPPPVPQRTAITVPTSTLLLYTGQYQLAPGVILYVGLDVDHLTAQLTGQSRFPIFAESETKFFFRVVDAQLTFVKDSSGAVTSAILHQNGINQTAPKIK